MMLKLPFRHRNKNGVFVPLVPRNRDRNTERRKPMKIQPFHPEQYSERRPRLFRVPPLPSLGEGGRNGLERRDKVELD
jgi:hypothetical protein